MRSLLVKHKPLGGIAQVVKLRSLSVNHKLLVEKFAQVRSRLGESSCWAIFRHREGSI